MVSQYDELKELYEKEKQEWEVEEGKLKGKIKELRKEINEAEEGKEEAEKKLIKVEKELKELQNTPRQNAGVSNDDIVDLYQGKMNTLQNQLQEKDSAIQALKQEWDETNKRLEKVLNAKPDTLNDTARLVREEWIDAIKVGVEEGGKVFPIFGSGAGALLGVGIGGVGLAVHSGIYAAEKAAEEGKEIGAFVIDRGITAADGAINHGKDVGAFVVNKSLQAANETANKGLLVLDGAKSLVENLFGVGENALKGKNFEEKLEICKEQMTNLQNEIIRLQKETGKKDERIEVLEKSQQELTAQIVQVALKK